MLGLNTCDTCCMEYTTISRACPCLFAEKRKKFGQWEETARQFSCHAVPDKNALLSAQLRAQLGFEQRKDALHILVGLLAGEAAVVRAQRQAERDGLAARRDADAAVNVEQLDLLQKALRAAADAVLQRADGNALGAHHGDIACNSGELRQRLGIPPRTE